MNSSITRIARWGVAALATSAALIGSGAAAPAESTADTAAAQAPAKGTKFDMIRSTGAVNAGCLKGATATVTVQQLGVVEKMTVKASGLPASTGFDLFVLQTPDAPFGVAWYQSDLQTDQSGNATVQVRGRFNAETFAVATGPADAPTPHAADAAINPPFAPIHTYHLGLWFNSAADAVAAGCPGTVTPFNGEHTAGIQAMSTHNFPPLDGPLGRIGG